MALSKEEILDNLKYIDLPALKEREKELTKEIARFEKYAIVGNDIMPLDSLYLDELYDKRDRCRKDIMKVNGKIHKLTWEIKIGEIPDMSGCVAVTPKGNRRTSSSKYLPNGILPAGARVKKGTAKRTTSCRK